MELKFELQDKQLAAFNSPATEILYGGSAGSGKRASLDTEFLTPFGFKKNKDFKVGDAITNPDGSVATVIQTHPVVLDDQYIVTFSDGSSTDCALEHLWLAWRSGKVKKKANAKVFGEESAQVVTTETLIKWLKTAKKQSERGTRPDWPLIPVTQEVVFNVANRWHKIDVDPYMLGILLGDGYLARTQISLTSMDDEIADVFVNHFKNSISIRQKENNQAKQYYALACSEKDEMIEQLTAHGVYGCLHDEKFIPDCYKYGSVEQRYALVQGLMDTDGTVGSRGHSSYCTTSKQLADDLRFVILSLGGTVTITTKDPFYKDEDGNRVYCKKAYILYIKHRDPSKLFRLTRKKELAAKARDPNMCRRIVDIKKVAENVPMRCITVSHPNGLYIQGRDFVVTHNSHLMRVASIIWSLEIPGLQTYLFRKEYKDLVLNHLYGEGGYFNLLAPLIDAGVCRIIGEEKIRFSNSSTIHLCHVQHDYKSVTKYQGAEIHLLLIDEVTHISGETYRFLRNRLRLGGLPVPEQYKGLFPRIICGTNPGGTYHSVYKDMFIDHQLPNEIVQMPPEEGGMTRQFIPALLCDNAVLMENDPNYADKLKGLKDPELVRAMLEGDWNISIGAFFGNLWKTDKIVVPTFEPVNHTWYADRSYDWGMSAPSAVCWFLESDGTSISGPNGEPFWMPKGSILMFKEYYTWNGTPNEGNREQAYMTARYIREVESKMPFTVHPGPADNAIFKTEYNDGRISADMEKEGVSWTRSDKSQGSRANGWAKMAGMLDATIKRDPERPWLMFLDCCKNTIRTLPTLPRDDAKLEDVDTKAEDHLADAIRYRITAQKQIMTIGKVSGF